MHKGKPVIVGHRPWWRHPVFPWGWYSLIADNLTTNESGGPLIEADGYCTPQDGGGGKFGWDGRNRMWPDNSGAYMWRDGVWRSVVSPSEIDT